LDESRTNDGNSDQLHIDYLRNARVVSGECIQNLKDTILANERRIENPAQFPAKFVSIWKKMLGVISE
jgi:hypothetical protein